MDASTRTALADAVRRIRDVDIKEHVGEISKRTAAEWLRAMVAAGVLKKVRRLTVGRWSDVDAWLLAGGQAPARRGRRSAP